MYKYSLYIRMEEEGPRMPSPIYRENTCYICTCESGSPSDDLGELIRVPCVKEEANQNCEGTLIHGTCLRQWIATNPLAIRCLNCHHSRLIIPIEYLHERILVPTYYYYSLPDNPDRHCRVCAVAIFIFILGWVMVGIISA